MPAGRALRANGDFFTVLAATLAYVMPVLYRHWQVREIAAMIEFLKKRINKSKEAHSRQAQLRLNDENEFLVMSCGSFNPRFLAKIKRSKDVIKRS